MSWVAWKQRHLWSGAPRTTCYSSGWSTYYYNCRCWAKTWLCWVILEYFHQSDQKNYVFQLVSFKNTCVYSFLWIAIHWVCHIDTNHSDKISMHRDAPVNRYTPIPNYRGQYSVQLIHHDDDNASPEHQHSWHWLCRMGKSSSYTRKDFKYLCHVCMEEW